MMGQREDGQRQFFYAFDLDKMVPADHLVRQIDAVLDLNWVHKELSPYYSHTGRPSIDPVSLLKTPKRRESLEIFAPPPYRGGHDHHDFRFHFAALIPLS